jgi:uncharacterized membrane protein YqjE
MNSTGPASDISGAARQLGATLLEMLHTRLELATVELAEARLGLAQQALCVTLVLAGTVAAMVFGVLSLAWWVGPQWRAQVLGGAALVWLLVAAAALWRWRVLQQRPPLLQASITLLRADAQALQRQPQARG